ncbi:MAG: NADH:ubiquinone reductase (Na(+)-transporting) subunit A [Planctomycetes bacterium]|nr:NADH:ubiquinone reductase (Na(+)-transporting) subunit A [Planctomycetota bacterium]
MITHKIRKGFDLPLVGATARRFEDAPPPPVVAVAPTEFPGLKAKLRVREGERVLTGQPLFHDKGDPGALWCAPATGTVSRVVLGARQALQRVEITCEAKDEFAELPRIEPKALASTPRPALVDALRAAGLWPLLRQRPVGKLPDPTRQPVAIFLNGMDTEPLAADPAFAVQGLGEDLQAGCDLLRALTDGPVYLTVRPGEQPHEYLALQGVEMHAFAGPHPAGLVGTHIQEIRPLRAGEVAWCLRTTDAVLLGRWLRTGRYPFERVVAVAGSTADESARRYARTRQGALVSAVFGRARIGEGERVIDGTVLSGRAIARDGFIGIRTTTVTTIPEGEDERDLLGWALPQPRRLTMHRAVFPLLGRRAVEVDARLHGGHRPIVNIGSWEAVTPLDILPSFLYRAIEANDLDEALKLGLLEVTEEDVALCTVVDPCKLDVGKVIRKGLDLYEREG